MEKEKRKDSKKIIMGEDKKIKEWISWIKYEFKEYIR